MSGPAQLPLKGAKRRKKLIIAPTSYFSTGGPPVMRQYSVAPRL